MRANSFIRAVLSMLFGALFYFALTINGSSQAADHIQHTVETHKAVVAIKKSPKSSKPKIETAERFVVQVVETSKPKPTPDPRIAEMAALASKKREERLAIQAEEHAKEARDAAKKAKLQAEKKAKEIAEKAKKLKVKEAFEDHKKKEERERKKKEAAAAKRIRESTKAVPVPSGVIGAGFGDRGPWARYHTGLDYRASYGTPVRAVQRGRIIYAGNKGNWAGNHVVIKHPDGKKTLYAHMSSISKSGGRVDQGDKIGRVGQSGRAFGAHLHLELYPEGATPGDVYSAINPTPWLRKQGIR